MFTFVPDILLDQERRAVLLRERRSHFPSTIARGGTPMVRGNWSNAEMQQVDLCVQWSRKDISKIVELFELLFRAYSCWKIMTVYSVPSFGHYPWEREW